MIIVIEGIALEVYLEFIERDDEVGLLDAVNITDIRLEGSDIDLSPILSSRAYDLLKKEVEDALI